MASQNRLPTLFEVLNRRTESPTDLWSFYVFMRDDQHNVDYLDFWIDVVQHLALCRNYVRGLRESLRSSYQNTSSLNSSVLEALLEGNVLDDRDSRRLSALLRGDEVDTDSKHSSDRLSKLLDSLEHEGAGGAAGPSGTNHSGSRGSGSGAASLNAGQKLPASPNRAYDRTGAVDGSAPQKTISAEKLELLLAPQEQEKRAQGRPTSFVTRKQIRDSCRRLLVTYFVPNAERELVLPPYIVQSVRAAIEVDGRDDPEVFDEPREYVYQGMERDAFPAFLARNALGNVNTRGAFLRLLIGLIALFAGFWTGLILIFLDWEPKRERVVVIVPFAIGVYLSIAGVYRLDPILALCGVTECGAEGVFTTVKERYVRKLLVRRALYVGSIIVLVAAVLTAILAAVPGNRL